MSNGEEKSKSKDFYEVLGLNKECTANELKNAYKKLALRWHPDRCSASANSKSIEEAKKKFQAIQQAYSVLSDDNKRFLYDVGVYDSDDDENGMGDFLNEMAVMMSQANPSENGEESFEQLQELFEEMFRGDMESFGGNFEATNSSSSSSYFTYCDGSSSNTRGISSESSSGKTKVTYCDGSSSNTWGISLESSSRKTKVEDSSSFHSNYPKFSLGRGGTSTRFQEGKGSKQRNSRGSRRRHSKK